MALFGRRPPAPVDGFAVPASETLHIRATDGCCITAAAGPRDGAAVAGRPTRAAAGWTAWHFLGGGVLELEEGNLLVHRQNNSVIFSVTTLHNLIAMTREHNMTPKAAVTLRYPQALMRSPKPPAGAILDENIYVSMRDGIQLAVDVYRPEGDVRYPVLLSLSPYSKEIQQLPPQWSHAIESGQPPSMSATAMCT